MSILTPERPAVEEQLDPVVPAAEVVPDADASTAEESPPINPTLTSLAAFLAAAGAGWLCGGIFGSLFARGVGVLGAVIGAGAVAVSYRLRRPSAIQYLGSLGAVVVGAILVMPDAEGGSANLVSLVIEAIRAGGIATPPVPFDPGWRFVLVVLTSVFASGAASLAIAQRRPRLAVFIPLPLVFGAAFVQPSDAPVAMTVIALMLVPAALTVCHGVELAKDGSTSGGFELRRLARSSGSLLVITAVMIVLGQLGLLFPEVSSNQVIPPQRPEPPPPQKDRVIFTIASDRLGPWRLGVLDVYDGKGWLLPPFDPARLEDIPASGAVPGAAAVENTYSASFTVVDVQGHVLPTTAGAQVVEERGSSIQFDPRTGMLRLPSRAKKGLAYTIESRVPPGGPELAAAPAAPPAVAEFLEVPPPPDEVVTLLGAAPTSNLYDRLQFVRNTFYTKVIAAGGGKPVDVPPASVVAMLAGGEATPFEITAAEALLARWAGVPSRVGYGFYGGDSSDRAGELEVRPRHGATWLEVYFEGHGWVAIVGTPPQAKSSLNDQEQVDRPDVFPSERLAISAYVPVRTTSVRLLFEIIRYWVVRAVPLVLGALAVWSFYPGVVKIVRRRLRRRFAARNGPQAAIAVAYADFRDATNDLNISSPILSPLEYLKAIAPDAEHEELAWLVTRVLWGDLRRGALAADVEVAQTLAASVVKRVRRAQPPTTRLIAIGSRVSLRDPWTHEVPNLWLKVTLRARLRAAARAFVVRLRRLPWPRLPFRRPVPRSAVVLLVLMTSLFVGACGGDGAVIAPRTGLPDVIAPELLRDLRFQREVEIEAAYGEAGDRSLIAEGRNFSIRRGDEVLGAFQVAAFKPGLIRSNDDMDEVRDGVIAGLGSGQFEVERLGNDIVLTQRQSRQNLFLWFPADMGHFQLFVASKDFEAAGTVFGELLAFQRGEELTTVAPSAATLEPIDPRRGGFR